MLVIGGGVIPEDDKSELEKEGVFGNFGPGTPLSTVIDYIHSGIAKLRKT